MSNRFNTVGRTATKVFTDNGDTVVQYHATEVVRFNQDRVRLSTGGWSTATTKRRMNQAANQYGLGFQVYQAKGVWYVVTEAWGRLEFQRYGKLEFTRRATVECLEKVYGFNHQDHVTPNPTPCLTGLLECGLVWWDDDDHYWYGRAADGVVCIIGTRDDADAEVYLRHNVHPSTW